MSLRPHINTSRGKYTGFSYKTNLRDLRELRGESLVRIESSGSIHDSKDGGGRAKQDARAENSKFKT